MPAGRPRTIKSPADFEAMAEAYFEKCEKTGEPLTVTGLCLAVGLSSRESLREYLKRPEFSDTIKRAKLKIEHSYELDLRRNKNVTGAIFALKNFNWSDKPINNDPSPYDSLVDSFLLR